MISIKRIIARPVCCGLVGVLALTACSDFSDYNDAPVDQQPSGNLTLWENISQNEQLSDFAALIRQAGFVDDLNSPRSLTVWAPVNGSFSLSDYQGMSRENLLQQFVWGHVAKYSHLASGEVNESVHMLNDKSFLFQGSGAYTFDGLTITQANVPSNNGIMHIINGVAPFYPNLYEYLSTAPGIDSLRNHFMRYELTYLDQNASVKGPMVNGVQTYIDSVMVTQNSLTAQLNARISNEDSSYTFIMPTDVAFDKMYERVKPYYNFINTTVVQDVENYGSATDTKTKNVTINAEYMTDSLVRRAIVRNLIFSNNDAYNQWLTNPNAFFTDTLRSTTRNKFSNPRELISAYRVGQPVEMSNGWAHLVDSLAFYPWETYCPELEISPRNWLANLFPQAAQAYRNVSLPDTLVERVFGADSYISNYRYLWIAPNGDRVKPDFCIQLPGVMSTTYNFYVVFLPSAWPEIGNDPRPNWLNFELNYCGANGSTAKYCFSKAMADSLLSGGQLSKVPTTVNASTAFTNNPEKCDTVFIGQFTFPVAYNGLGEYYPSIRVTSPISVFSSAQLAEYSRDIRIATILMRPVELDEFEAKNK